MAEINDADLIAMRALFRECRMLFRRLEKAAVARLTDPLSLVETQSAQREVDLFKSFGDACSLYEAQDMQKATLTET